MQERKQEVIKFVSLVKHGGISTKCTQTPYTVFFVLFRFTREITCDFLFVFYAHQAPC